MSGPVRLTLGDLGACLSLSVEAGWNQNERDWEFILGQGEAYGLRQGPRLVATAAILPYPPRLGWVCMVLVTAAARRLGHASTLMRQCLARLDELGLVAGLDATTEGAEVYRRLGFESLYPVTRFAGHGGMSPFSSHGVEIAPAGPSDLAELAAYDAACFGGDRHQLLAALLQRAPGLSYVARLEGLIAGFALGREGRTAAQIGPVVARHPQAGETLVARAIAAISGPCLIDAPDHQPGLRAFLEARGFVPQRSFMRMLLRRSQPFGEPASIVTIAGPEFG